MLHRFPFQAKRPPLHQRRFRFAERGDRLARRFKRWILGLTMATLCLLVLGTASGRYAASWTFGKLHRGFAWLTGDSNDRSWIDADWRRRRLFDMDQARTKLTTAYDAYDPRMRLLVDAAGLDPEHALLRWGNFDKALLLPSTVYEPDDSGRSYRFRPQTRSIWVRNMKSQGGVLAYFQLPDSPANRKLAEEASAVVVVESVQNTNSWGLRGGEPDVSAELRGIVLGDSYMQGLFVGDDQTPSECLKRVLADRNKSRVEILNTGHLGYSPEQEYFTLLEYAERFPPQFVILSLFANDFGDLFEVLEGRADWEENRHWIGRIVELCQKWNIPCLVVPAPWVNHVEGARQTAHYPGRVPDIIPSGAIYFDPMEDFIEAEARETLRRLSQGEPTSPSSLFNGKLGDGHFSVLGCQIWAGAVGRRLGLLLDLQRAGSRPRQ
ncbi:SGNH/GDSL hydrolase family protein [Paludisphaera rhizosphaerae]|uniref:SGNH/GDSL hydrolase family protein n=1 Tax=Paludisphaera rhizosphaerae TaxID=2711216 RepID=UPI0013EB81AF|nr:SGNH/GDSL hydrolase family protein [Paludisphaera rhizosphaerae]